jgi:hypothetical protein
MKWYHGTMKEQEFSVEVCQGQVCHFLGKNVITDIKEGISDLENVTTREGYCRNNCNSATNVYLFKGKEDIAERHFARVNRKYTIGPSTEEVIVSIREIISNQSENR